MTTVSRVGYSLDHVGFVGSSLEPMRASMQRLGFLPTEPRLLMRVDTATGELVSLGQESCHVVLEAGYVELSAVLTADPSHHLAAYLPRGPGLHILALGHDDVDAAASAAAAGGVPCTAPAGAARRIDYGLRHGEARFRWFMVEPQASPEGLVCVVRNLTPELVFQPEVMAHPNGALGLAEVFLRVADPVRAARRFEALLGTAAEPAEHGGLQFSLAGGRLTLSDGAGLERRLGPCVAQIPDGRFAGMRIRVADLTTACAALERGGVPAHARGHERIVTPPQACGAVLVFTE